MEADDLEFFDEDQQFTNIMSGEPCGEEWLSLNFIAQTDDALRQT